MQENANTQDLVTIGQPAIITKVLDSLPGMIGAIDNALIDTAGQRLPFVLLVFAENGAMHATNLTPAEKGVEAVKHLAEMWANEEPKLHEAVHAAVDAANAANA